MAQRRWKWLKCKVEISQENVKNIFSFPILITVRSSQSSSKTQLCGYFNIFSFSVMRIFHLVPLCVRKSFPQFFIGSQSTQQKIGLFPLGLLVKDLILLCVKQKWQKGRKKWFPFPLCQAESLCDVCKANEKSSELLLMSRNEKVGKTQTEMRNFLSRNREL